MPSMAGMENPQMSPSTIPTLMPDRARATAMLAEIEDLPTPPLPEETATVRAGEPGSPIPGPAFSLRALIQALAASSSITSMSTSAPLANGFNASSRSSLRSSWGPGAGARNSTLALPVIFLDTCLTRSNSPSVLPTNRGDSMDATAS